MKKIMALCIAVIITALSLVTAFAADGSAVLYNYYGDNMLFKQNDDAVFAGKADKGTYITCVLRNSRNKQVAFSDTVASSDGTFSLSFTAPEGSFEEYTVTLAANGHIFDELTGVVFGELWLAGGQSNMQMPLTGSKTGAEMAAQNKTGSDALRFLDVPHIGTYKGDENRVPSKPMTDYENKIGWYKGSEANVYGLSAVGYYFAENLIEELDMPVGILNANLGGSSILSWLSREAIENDKELLADCKSYDRYIPLYKWNEKKIDQYSNMTANFNKIIAPLENFRLSGMIWYQGESDIFWNYGTYTKAFNAMQKLYTEHFSYDDGLLPIVFTQLAAYSYGNLTELQNMNVEFAHIQMQNPESRALTSILDIPLDYTVENHAIHPLCKKEVGAKMAYAAMGLVYDMYDSFTAATVESTEIKDGCVYVTLRDVGDKLIVDGNTVYGFSLCADDGIYLPANAEIVAENKVKVWSESVVNPVSVAYAYSQTNSNANLFASRNGEKLLAVSPFVSDLSFSRHHWNNEYWAGCDYESYWHCHTNEFSGFYNTWNVNGAEISFKKSEIDAGNAIYIKSNNEKFSICPNFVYNENGKTAFFQDIDLNWSDYGTLTFKVKINSANDVEFSGLKIQVNDELWVMPAIKDNDSTSLILAGNGETYTVTLNLECLYAYGDMNGAVYNSSVLDSLSSAEFMFTDISGNGAELCFDSVGFTATERPEEEELSFFEKIKEFFISLYEKIFGFFAGLFN